MADANHRFSTLIGGLRQLITPITTSAGATGEEGLYGCRIFLYKPFNDRCWLWFTGLSENYVNNEVMTMTANTPDFSVTGYDEAEFSFSSGNIDSTNHPFDWALYGYK